MKKILIILILLTLSFSITAADKEKDPVWDTLQQILNLGVVEMKFKAKYGDFTHNAFDYKKLKNSAEGQAMLKKQMY